MIPEFEPSQAPNGGRDRGAVLPAPDRFDNRAGVLRGVNVFLNKAFLLAKARCTAAEISEQLKLSLSGLRDDPLLAKHTIKALWAGFHTEQDRHVTSGKEIHTTIKTVVMDVFEGKAKVWLEARYNRTPALTARNPHKAEIPRLP